MAPEPWSPASPLDLRRWALWNQRLICSVWGPRGSQPRTLTNVGCYVSPQKAWLRLGHLGLSCSQSCRALDVWMVRLCRRPASHEDARRLQLTVRDRLDNWCTRRDSNSRPLASEGLSSAIINLPYRAQPFENSAACNFIDPTPAKGTVVFAPLPPFIANTGTPAEAEIPACLARELQVVARGHAPRWPSPWATDQTGCNRESCAISPDIAVRTNLPWRV